MTCQIVIYKLQWSVIEIRHYITRAGKDVFDDWLSQLADNRAQAKIASRINRLAAGNFGDCKPLRRGLCELRIDWGPGYRVYYAMLGRICVLLLCGGDKRKQSSDIDRALEYLKDYKERTGTHEA
jgi:putative addiction module killer protein